jgi:MFS family permease
MRSRFAVAAVFFLHGLCFSSWGSRIPAIQQKLGLSDSHLGTVLFALPVGLILSMPLSSWVVARFGSRNVLAFSIAFYGALLAILGLAATSIQLALELLLFGLASNMVNISVNTQAVAVERNYGKSIMASFHGLWSLAGFTGAAIGTVMIGLRIPPFRHFLLILVVVWIGIALSFQWLIIDGRTEGPREPVFVIPEKTLLQLGLIAFCSMTCEGAMFDWSGVYFKKVVLAEGAWVGVGYTAFMSTMAGTRFIADRFVGLYGLRRILQFSGSLAALGLSVAVIFPSLWTAAIGFLMVGAGVSAVIPLVFGAAGKSKNMSPSSAIAAVSTIGFIGFLIGPPLIGWIAGASSLRVSFAVIAIAALFIPWLAREL